MMDAVQLLALAIAMRKSQKRWPDHPQQVSLETLTLERRFDEEASQWVCDPEEVKKWVSP